MVPWGFRKEAGGLLVFSASPQLVPLRLWSTHGFQFSCFTGRGDGLSSCVLQMACIHQGGLKSLTPSYSGVWSYSPSSLNPHESGWVTSLKIWLGDFFSPYESSAYGRVDVSQFSHSEKKTNQLDINPPQIFKQMAFWTLKKKNVMVARANMALLKTACLPSMAVLQGVEAKTQRGRASI